MTTKSTIFRHFSLLGVLLLLIVFGCKKEDTPTNEDYFIKSKVNGALVTAAYVYPNSDLVYNAYITEDLSFQIPRGVSASSSQGWSIYVSNLDLDHITYPKTLILSGAVDAPYIDVLYNNGTSGAQGNFVIDDYETYPFNITLTKWSNNILEGTFEGKLRWGGGVDSTATFNNGEFRLKLVRF